MLNLFIGLFEVHENPVSGVIDSASSDQRIFWGFKANVEINYGNR